MGPSTEVTHRACPCPGEPEHRTLRGHPCANGEGVCPQGPPSLHTADIQHDTPHVCYMVNGYELLEFPEKTAPEAGLQSFTSISNPSMLVSVSSKAPCSGMHQLPNRDREGREQEISRSENTASLRGARR